MPTCIHSVYSTNQRVGSGYIKAAEFRQNREWEWGENKKMLSISFSCSAIFERKRTFSAVECSEFEESREIKPTSHL